MMTTTHTPGPWTVRTRKDRTIDIWESDKFKVATVLGSTACGEQREIFEQRAALIASAPELLEQLELAVKFLNAADDDGLDPYTKAMSAVIAKAKGGTR